MKNNIIFTKLSEDSKEYWINRVVACKLQQYVNMYTKMRKIGITPLEILSLRGLPMNYNDIRTKLEKGEIIINEIDNNECEIIEKC